MTTAKLCLLLISLCAFCSAFAEDSFQDPEIDCHKSLSDNTSLQVLKGKLQFGLADEPTLEMLGNIKKPTTKEKSALPILVSFSEGCIHRGDEWRAINWPPGVIALFDERVLVAKTTIADLYAGSITYGEFSKRAIFANAKLKKDLSAFTEKMKAEKSAMYEAELLKQRQLAEEKDRLKREQLVRDREQASRDVEIQQRNAQLAFQQEQARRAAVLQMYGIQQQAQQNWYEQQMNAIRGASPRHSIDTNCYSSGNMTNCTSR